MKWLKKLPRKESSIQNDVLKYLKSDNRVGFVRKWSDRWHSGIPDIFCIVESYPVFIELKRPSGKTTKLQDAVIAEIINAGGYARVCKSVSDVKEFIDEVCL